MIFLIRARGSWCLIRLKSIAVPSQERKRLAQSGARAAACVLSMTSICFCQKCFMLCRYSWRACPLRVAGGFGTGIVPAAAPLASPASADEAEPLLLLLELPLFEFEAISCKPDRSAVKSNCREYAVTHSVNSTSTYQATLAETSSRVTKFKHTGQAKKTKTVSRMHIIARIGFGP